MPLKTAKTPRAWWTLNYTYISKVVCFTEFGVWPLDILNSLYIQFANDECVLTWDEGEIEKRLNRACSKQSYDNNLFRNHLRIYITDSCGTPIDDLIVLQYRDPSFDLVNNDLPIKDVSNYSGLPLETFRARTESITELKACRDNLKRQPSVQEISETPVDFTKQLHSEPLKDKYIPRKPYPYNPEEMQRSHQKRLTKIQNLLKKFPNWHLNFSDQTWLKRWGYTP